MFFFVCYNNISPNNESNMCEICLIYIDQIIMSKMFHPAGLKKN